ncbi:MAG TPA: hypothetical protein VLC09_21475 [Polyangiaceae bacterium]|nr:hypothetical protein [Polyangiaceae bacterium]
MVLPAVLIRPEAFPAASEEPTVRYALDARLIRAARAAREARRHVCVNRGSVLALSETLRVHLGEEAHRLTLNELDRLELTLDRVPRALWATLVVSLSQHIAVHSARGAFLRAASELAQTASVARTA